LCLTSNASEKVVYPGGDSQGIQRAADAAPSAVQEVGIEHRRRDVLVTEQLLNCSDIVPVLEEMRGERVPESMAARGFVDTRLADRFAHGALEHRLVGVVAQDGAAPRIPRKLPGREDVLPRPFARRPGVLPGHGVREADPGQGLGEVELVEAPHTLDLGRERLLQPCAGAW
jgi:hypothetical protein